MNKDGWKPTMYRCPLCGEITPHLLHRCEHFVVPSIWDSNRTGDILLGIVIGLIMSAIIMLVIGV